MPGSAVPPSGGTAACEEACWKDGLTKRRDAAGEEGTSDGANGRR